MFYFNGFKLLPFRITGGELFERVINDDFILTEKACIIFMRQICEGVEFMHSKDILHLDMKVIRSVCHCILCKIRRQNVSRIIDLLMAKTQ